MRVRLEIEGGFAPMPGLYRPIRLDSEVLGSADQGRLADLIEAANFFALPANLVASLPHGADTRRYRLTVEDGLRHHSVSFGDPVGNQALVALRAFVQAHAG